MVCTGDDWLPRQPERVCDEHRARIQRRSRGRIVLHVIPAALYSRQLGQGPRVSSPVSDRLFLLSFSFLFLFSHRRKWGCDVDHFVWEATIITLELPVMIAEPPVRPSATQCSWLDAGFQACVLVPVESRWRDPWEREKNQEENTRKIQAPQIPGSCLRVVTRFYYNPMILHLHLDFSRMVGYLAWTVNLNSCRS